MKKSIHPKTDILHIEVKTDDGVISMETHDKIREEVKNLYVSTIPLIKTTIPAITSTGIAMYISPANTSPIRSTGSKSTTQMNFAIPHVSLSPKRTIFHISQTSARQNKIVNI